MAVRYCKNCGHNVAMPHVCNKLLKNIEVGVTSRLTFRISDDKVVFPIQSEIEDIAIENMGTAEYIYFDDIKLTDEFYVQFDKGEMGWILKSRKENQI